MTAAENETAESEALSMFFNDDFLPQNYVDALFDFTLAPSSSTPLSRHQMRAELASFNTLQLLQSKCSSLLVHLDYYTKELTGDLEDRIKKLQASSTVISFDQLIDDEAQDATTRLEYYVENLTNCISSLHDDIETYNRRIKEIETPEADRVVLKKLTSLKKVKLGMLAVVKIFETAKVVATTSELDDDSVGNLTNIAPTSTRQARNISVDLDVFSKSIYLLEGAIDEELQTANDENRKHIIRKIDNLVGLSPLFKNLPKFYSIYFDFAERIREKRDTH